MICFLEGLSCVLACFSEQLSAFGCAAEIFLLIICCAGVLVARRQHPAQHDLGAGRLRGIQDSANLQPRFAIKSRLASTNDWGIPAPMTGGPMREGFPQQALQQFPQGPTKLPMTCQTPSSPWPAHSRRRTRQGPCRASGPPSPQSSRRTWVPGPRISEIHPGSS